MSAYGMGQSNLGSLLRMIQEERAMNPAGMSPAAEQSTPIRESVSTPVMGATSPGTFLVGNIKPEGIDALNASPAAPGAAAPASTIAPANPLATPAPARMGSLAIGGGTPFGNPLGVPAGFAAPAPHGQPQNELSPLSNPLPVQESMPPPANVATPAPAPAPFSAAPTPFNTAPTETPTPDWMSKVSDQGPSVLSDNTQPSSNVLATLPGDEEWAKREKRVAAQTPMMTDAQLNEKLNVGNVLGADTYKPYSSLEGLNMNKGLFDSHLAGFNDLMKQHGNDPRWTDFINTERQNILDTGRQVLAISTALGLPADYDKYVPKLPEATSTAALASTGQPIGTSIGGVPEGYRAPAPHGQPQSQLSPLSHPTASAPSLATAINNSIAEGKKFEKSTKSKSSTGFRSGFSNLGGFSGGGGGGGGGSSW